MKLDQLTKKHAELKAEIAEKQRELATLEKNIKEEQSKIQLSDHAIVRYFERVKHSSFRAIIAEELLPVSTRNMYATLGNGVFPTALEGVRVVIKKGVVVTVLGRDQQ